MKRVFFLIFNLALIIAMSCEGGLLVDCNDCDWDEPYEARLTGKIDIHYHEGVLVQVWEGTQEDGLLIDSALVYTSTFEKTVPLNRQYTLAATYVIDGKTYVVVNSASPKVKYTDSQCDDPCYQVYGDNVNLKLKHK